MSDDRRSPEQLAIDAAAQSAPPPVRRTEPCRRYVQQPDVTAEEVEAFLKELEGK
jgi:hypothetical protein